MKQSYFYAIFLVCAAFVAPCLGQEKLRTIEHHLYRNYEVSTEPIAVISRRVDDRPFLDDTRVNGKSDWLRNLTLGVKNISKRTIVGFQIHVVIPKQQNMEYAWVMIMSFPMASKRSDSDQSAITTLKSNEIVEVSVPDSQRRMLEDLKKYGVTDIEWVSLRFDTVNFADGTRWYQGVEMKQDPNQPGRFVPIGLDGTKLP